MFEVFTVILAVFFWRWLEISDEKNKEDLQNLYGSIGNSSSYEEDDD